jgi:hypothetical protein
MVRLAAAGGILLALCVAVPAIGAQWDSGPFPPVHGNPADRLDEVPIDDFEYDFARHCTRHPRPGTRALEAWLGSHWRGVSWGIMRCSKLGKDHYSLHAEGRALDWHLDVHDALDRAAAERLIGLMLAPDQLGNPAALARRMGVQELIWNCRAWFSGSPVLVKYRACYNKHGKRRKHVDDTSAHRNHVHIGLTRRGAKRRTTFWEAR